MTKEQIKQLAREEFGSMAHLGRKLNPPITGQYISMLIDGKRNSHRAKQQISRKLKLRKSDWPTTLSSPQPTREQAFEAGA